MSSDSGCCPPDSEPPRSNDYQPRGVEITVDDLQIYTVGEGPLGIVVIPDIFGFKGNGSRIRLVCDQLADAGYNVVLPGVFRGEPCDGNQWPPEDWSTFFAWVKRFPWEGGLEVDLDRCVRVLKDRGVTKMGIMGFCWGSFVVFKGCASGDFSVGVSPHPSHIKIAELLDAGDDFRTLAEGVTCPQLLLPAAGDDAMYKPGSEMMAILEGKEGIGAAMESVEYPEMTHGWVIRGDLNEPAVVRDADDALARATAAFDRFLKEA